MTPPDPRPAITPAVESAKSLVRDYGVTILLAVIAALGIRFFVIEAYRIPSTSMRPTLEPGDTIFVTKSAFGLRWPGSENPFTDARPPHRGEVVIYRSQAPAPGQAAVDSIRRVVAIGGDRVEYKDSKLHINGVATEVTGSRTGNCVREKIETHEFETCAEPPLMEPIAAQVVPQDSALVMGDYRVAYTDIARKTPNWQIIQLKQLRGRAFVLWLSIEPRAQTGRESGWFSRIRFERMLRSIP